MVSWFDHFRTPAWRPYRALMFVGLGLSGVVPILHALSVYGYRQLDERMGLSWVILQGGLYIFGAFLYAVSGINCSWLRAYLLTNKPLTAGRSAGRNANPRVPSTSGGARTSCSTSSSCLLRRRICMAWPKPSIIITACWVPSVKRGR